jgi:hypothetical protein
VEGHLVGVEPGAFLIIRPRRNGQVAESPSPGDPVQALHLCEGTVYGYDSTFLGRINRPAHLVFITFPDQVTARSLRRHPRLTAYLPALARFGGEERAGVLLDLSLEGCRLAYPHHPEETQPKVGESVDLALRLLDEEPPGLAEGVVRSVKVQAGVLVLGIKFEAEGSGCQALVRAYLERLAACATSNGNG